MTLPLQVKHSEFDEYCHWSFPDDDKGGEPSYMMARRLKPKTQRHAPTHDSVIERSRSRTVEERPPVVPSGKRAAFIKAIEEAKAIEAAKKQEWADSAWHCVEVCGRTSHNRHMTVT